MSQIAKNLVVLRTAPDIICFLIFLPVVVQLMYFTRNIALLFKIKSLQTYNQNHNCDTNCLKILLFTINLCDQISREKLQTV